MRRRAVLAAVLAAFTASPAPAAGPTPQLEAMADAALDKPETDETRLAAIGRAIRAHEAALVDLRAAIGDVTSEEAAIRERIAAEEGDLAPLLSGLQSLSNAPASALLAYPGQPLRAARAAMLLDDMLPRLETRASKLEGRLARLATLERQQAEAAEAARRALGSLDRLRAASRQALAARPVPRDVPSEQAAADAETLAALAEALGQGRAGPRLGFDSAMGRLPLPAAGKLTGRFGPREGWIVATPAYAQVVAPWDGTVRYAGSLGSHGKVMVLEPETGYLIMLAGLGRIDRRVGEVVLAGEPLGEMGGALPGVDEFLFEAAADDDLIGAGELYLELRHQGRALDPAEWFRQQDG